MKFVANGLNYRKLTSFSIHVFFPSHPSLSGNKPEDEKPTIIGKVCEDRREKMEAFQPGFSFGEKKRKIRDSER